jgi:outer membrane protein
MARDIDEKKKRLERDMQDAEEDLKGEQQKLLQGLGGRMMAVIEKYAKDNGYSMILDVSNPNTPVLYASSGIDITQDIVSLYDKTSTNGGPAGPAGAPGPAGVKPTPKTPGDVK